MKVFTGKKRREGALWGGNYFYAGPNKKGDWDWMAISQKHPRTIEQKEGKPECLVNPSLFFQELPPRLQMSSKCRGQPQLRLHQLRQPALGHAHHIPTHYARLLGKRLQHGEYRSLVFQLVNFPWGGYELFMQKRFRVPLPCSTTDTLILYQKGELHTIITGHATNMPIAHASMNISKLRMRRSLFCTSLILFHE